MTSMLPRLVRTRASASRSKRFSAATNTRTCCAGACFAEGLASFSEPRRVETCPLERSFISLSDIGVPFPFAAGAFVLEALALIGLKQSQREQVVHHVTAPEKRELIVV